MTKFLALIGSVVLRIASCIFVVTCLAFFGSEARAAEIPDYAKVQLMVKKAFPTKNYAVQNFSVGDLNGDGKNDVAAILYEYGEHEPSVELAVFFAGQADTFELRGVSVDYCRTHKWHELEIRNATLNVDTAYGTYTSFTSRVLRFKLKDGELALIGEDNTTTEDNNADGNGSSANYLSNQAVFWRKIGERRQEVRKTLMPMPLVTLNTFDCYSYEDLLPKEVRGYFDDKLNFISY